MKLDWLKYTGITAIVGIIALTGYGSYRWFFNRPPQYVYQNTYQNYTVMPGANQTISNYETKGTTKDRRLFTGLYGNGKEAGITVGWLW